LQEDNDGSHGHRKYGLASELRDANWVPILTHPAQSPDLNPMEACWNILKQRVRKGEWKDLEELKEVIQKEWRAITIEQVRERIAEMPERCKSLVKTGGKAIRSKLW
jgi:transposase